MRAFDKFADRLRRAAVGTGLRFSWRELLLPAGLLLGCQATTLAGFLPPGALHALAQSLGGVLGFAFLAASGLAASRFIATSARREAMLRELAALGDDAPLGTLLSVLDAELTSRPAFLRQHLTARLENVRGVVARRIASSLAAAQPFVPRRVRRWLFEPAPAGSFPPYAEDLLTLAEVDPGTHCLPLMRDLRSSAAHVAETASDRTARIRADALVERIAGAGRTHALDRAALLRLIGRLARGSELDRTRAEQELRALGPEAVVASSRIRPRRQWWWGLPGFIVAAAGLLIWYFWDRHISVGTAIHLPAALRQIPLYDRVSPMIRGLIAVGAAGLAASWVAKVPVAWSRFRTRRVAARLADALSAIEGREAVAALLDVLRSSESVHADAAYRARSLARAARRLVDLPASVAAELLAPHGSWFFRRPLAPTPQDYWIHEEQKARALLAVVRHTWDPAALPLLRYWARNRSCPVRAQAQTVLDELEARLARQGTLLMPAPTCTEDSLLLRPATLGETESGTLLRPSGVGSAEQCEQTDRLVDSAVLRADSVL